VEEEVRGTGPVIINGTQLPNGKVFGYPSIQCLRAAELFLLEKAQKGLKTSRMRSLNVDTKEDVIGVKRKLVVIGSRGGTRYKECTDKPTCRCWPRSTS
jgi:hypothetical protein